MKRRVVSITLLVLCFSALFDSTHSVVAQVPPQASPQAQQAAKKLEKLSKQLKLTPEQKLKLAPILEAEAPKLQAIRSNTSLTDAQKLVQISAVHQESDPQVKAILSPQQYEQLQKARQKEVKEAIKKKGL